MTNTHITLKVGNALRLRGEDPARIHIIGVERQGGEWIFQDHSSHRRQG